MVIARIQPPPEPQDGVGAIFVPQQELVILAGIYLGLPVDGACRGVLNVPILEQT